MASVTVPGPNGQQTTLTSFDNKFNFALAQNIANVLSAASNSGSLFVGTASVGGAIPSVPTGKIGELFIAPGMTGNITVPAGYSYLVDDSLGPDTIVGSPNLSIIGGGGTHTIIDPSVIALAGDTTAGASSDNVTVSGLGDNVAVGDGNNTLTGTGSGTLSGGTGTNLFDETVGSYVINSQGTNDTIKAGSGATTVLATGTAASILGGSALLIADLTGDGATLRGGGGVASVAASGNKSELFGGAGGLDASISGTSDTLVGGAGATAATLTGSDALVSGSGSLSVLDLGTADTIDAGSGSTTVSAPGGSFVKGGSGDLTFVGGAGGGTIVGSSGDSTVFGGTGLTSIVGAAGGAVTYVNTTAGSMFYTPGTGSETLDASLSKTGTLLAGGHDTAGQNLLIGGAGDDVLTAGAGNSTLVGGGGANTFQFSSSLGGPTANVVIADFSAIDNATFVGYNHGEVTKALKHASTSGGSTTITLSDGTTITFDGVTDTRALTGHIQQA